MQEVRHDESRGPIEPFDADEAKRRLENPNVKEIAVFGLQKGMRIIVEGQAYKVITVRENGKITMRREK
jgi:hypothetical protein